MDVFDLYAKISLDSSNFKKGIQSATENVKKVGSSIKGGLKTAAKVGTVATAAVGAAAAVAGKKVLNMANDTAAAGDAIDKNSQKLGLSRKAYQEWDYVLSQSGVDISSMTMGLKTMTNQIGKANKGSKDATANFQKLGISANDLKTLSREELFEKSIKGLQGMKDNAERAALANTLFGRSGVQLQPLLNSSAKSVDELKQKANELGFVMSDKAVNAARDYTDSMDTLKRTFTGVKNRIMSELLPSFKSIMDGFSGLLAGQKGAEGTFTKGVTSLVSSFSKVIPQFTTIIMSIVKAVTKVAPSIISALVSGIIDNLPTLINSAISIVSALISAIISAIPQLVSVLPTLITGLLNLFSGIISQLPVMIQQLITALIQQLPTILQSILAQLPTIINGLISLVLGIVNALPTIFENLIIALPTVIRMVIQAFKDNLPLLIKGAIKLVIGLVQAAPKILLSLIEAIPDIIDAIIDGFINNIETLVLGAIQLVVELVKNMPRIILALIKAIPKIVTSIVKAFTKLGGKFLDIGKNLVKGIWDGIVGMGSWLWEKISGFFGGIVDKVKNFFGIKSPSKLFRDQIGKNLALGIGEGFSSEMDKVFKEMQGSLDNVSNLEAGFSYTSNGSQEGIIKEQSFNISINNPQVRKEADIDEIANKVSDTLGKMFRKRSMSYG